MIGADARYKALALSVTSGPGAFSVRGLQRVSTLVGGATQDLQLTDATLFGVQSRASGIISFGNHFGISASMHSTIMENHTDNRIRLTGYSVGFRIQ